MIGQTIWRFDPNYRDYPRNDKGHATGMPIYRSHWRPEAITGETPKFWLANNGFRTWKVNRKTMMATAPMGGDTRFVMTEQEVEDDVWAHESRHKIWRAVERCDVPTLRKVAELVGWEGKA